MTPRDATRGRQIEQYVEEPEFKEEHKSRALQQLSAVSGRLYDMAAKSEAAKEAKKGCVPALYPDFAHEVRLHNCMSSITNTLCRSPPRPVCRLPRRRWCKPRCSTATMRSTTATSPCPLTTPLMTATTTTSSSDTAASYDSF